MHKIFSSIIFIFIFIPPLFAYQANFSPGIAISAEYVDNINLIAGDETFDIITSVAPQFVFELLGVKSGFNLSFDPLFRNYEKGTQENQILYNSSGSLWTGITRNARIELTNTFSSSDDPAEGDDTTVRRNREYYYQNDSGIRIENRFGASNLIYLVYGYSILENDDPLVEDNKSSSPGFGITYESRNHWGIQFGMTNTNGHFDISDDFDNINGNLTLTKIINTNFNSFLRYSHTIMQYKGNAENYQIYDPSLGINYQAGDAIFFSISLSYLIRDMSESEDEAGLTLSGNLQKTWQLRRGSVNVTGESGYNESYFGAENLGFEIFYQTSFSAEYRITRLLSFNLSGSTRYDDYRNLESDRDDLSFEGSTGLTLDLQRYIHIDMTYSYTTVNSTINENDYDENRVLLMVRLSSPTPLRVN